MKPLVKNADPASREDVVQRTGGHESRVQPEWLNAWYPLDSGDPNIL